VFLELEKIKTLDVTGGAPELHPHFRELVTRARSLGVHVIDRCNLTILEEPGQEDLAAFLSTNEVEVIASLPCYTEELVDRQRGKGVYEKSVRAIRVERAGLRQSADPEPRPQPAGAALPPAQGARARVLGETFGVVFNRLFALANMPIQRFGSTLISKGQFNEYMALLHGAHRDENISAVMCRTLLSVDWQGYVYDCDFNQMLDLPLTTKNNPRPKLADLIGRDLEGNPVAVRDHCYGCTAGQGSSCGGAL
jgi:radical SAM/Cys-rich protein